MKSIILRIPLALIIFWMSVDYFSARRAGFTTFIDVPSFSEQGATQDFDAHGHQVKAFKREDGSISLQIKKYRDTHGYILAALLSLAYLFSSQLVQFNDWVTRKFRWLNGEDEPTKK